MAEPTVKVKVVVDDSEAQQKIAALAANLKNAFSQASGKTLDFGNVGQQLTEISKGFESMGKSLGKAQKDMAAFNKSMGELERKTAKPKEQLTGFRKTLDDANKGFMAAQKGIFAFNNTMFAAQVVINTIRDSLKFLWETAKEGAVINTTTAAFERLSVSLIQVPDLLNQLQVASRSTISDLSLMQQTLSLVQGAAPDLARALGQAAPALLEVARASAILNPALGSAEQNFARLALGIRRSSVRILDDIGLVIKLQDAYDAFAEKTNQSVKELDGQEKQLALLQGTLREGENLINALGDSATSQVDAFQQLTASWTNFTNSIKSGLAEAIVPLMRILSGDLKLSMDAALEAISAPEVRGDPFKEIIDGAQEAQKVLREFEEGGQIFAGILQTDPALVARNMSGFNDALDELISKGAGVAESGTEFLSFIRSLQQVLGEDFVESAFTQQIVEGLGEASKSARDFAASINALEKDGLDVFQSFPEIMTGLARSSGSLQELADGLAAIFDLVPGTFEDVVQQLALLRGLDTQDLIAQLQELFQLEQQMASAAAADEIMLRWAAMGETGLQTAEDLETLLKVWGAIDFGKGMPEEVAALAVSLGLISPAAAEAAVAAQELTESFEMLLDKGDEFTDLTGNQQALALLALNQRFADTAEAAIEWGIATSQVGGAVQEALLADAVAMVEAAKEAQKLADSWDGIDLGAKGVSEGVAALNVALGTMTQAEADAAVASFNLHANFAMLAEDANFAKLSTEQQALALYALQFGLAETSAEAIIAGVQMSNLSEAEKQAAIAALQAAAGFTEAGNAVAELAKVVGDAAAEILKTKGASGELAAEFIKAAQAAGATADQLIAAAAATGLLTAAELEAISVTAGLAAIQEALFAAVRAGSITFAQAASMLIAYAQAASVAAGAMTGLAAASKGFGSFVNELNASLGGGGGGGGGLLDSLGTFRDTFIETITAVGEAQADLDKAIAEDEDEEKIKDLTKALGEASGATRNWKKELFDLTIEAGASVEQIIALGLATGVLTEKQAQAAFKQAAAAAAIEKLAQAYVSGSISAEEAAAAVGQVQKAIASGGDIDLSAFGISVGNLATQTARAGGAAGGAAKETRTWRDDLLDLADAEDVTAQKAVELARQTGKFTEEQIASALQSAAMTKAVESFGDTIDDLPIDDVVAQLEALESVIGQLSTDELALFLDLGVKFDLSPGEVADAISLFLGGDMTIEQAIDVVLKAKVSVEVESGPSGGPIDLAEIPAAMMRGGQLPAITGGQPINIPIQVDATDAQNNIGGVRDNLLALGETTTTTTLDADTTDAESALAGITSDLTAYEASTYTSTADLDTSAAEAALAAFIASASTQVVTIPVEFEIGSVPTPPANADDTASRGARVLPGDVILVGDSGRSNPSELFVTDEYLASNGRNTSGINAPRVIGANGPMFFEASTPGFVLPYVPTNFEGIRALAEMIRARDGAGIGDVGFGNLEDLSGEEIIDALRRGARWTVEDFLRTGRFEFFPTVYDSYSTRNRPRRNPGPSGFSEGGYTGVAGGIVHGGEYVFNAEATSNLGINTLEALHAAANSTSGLAEALGMVSPSLFGLPLSSYDGVIDSDQGGRDNINNSLIINVANAKDARTITRRELGAIV